MKQLALNLLDTESVPFFFKMGIDLDVAAYDYDSNSRDDLIDFLSTEIRTNAQKMNDSNAIKEEIVGSFDTR